MSIQSVPTIDISPLISSQPGCPKQEELEQQCVNEIRKACSEWGFFYIENHGISKELIQSFRYDIDRFFHLPQEDLDTIRRTEKNSRGYFDDELTKNKLDWKRCFDVGAQNGSLDNIGMDGWNQWPNKNSHSSFESTIRTYFYEMEKLSAVLLRAVCRSLDVEPEELLENHFVGKHTSYLRLNYYPVCPDPSSTLAVHHHTDAGALTILYQDDDVTSLQVNKNSQWHFIPPRKGTFVINIGDMIQVWSNDKYKAPLHQVQANSSSNRYSAPFFYNPSYASNVSPLVQDEEEPKYTVVNWGEFRAKRFAGDYADLGEEVQISHYRVNS